MSVITEPEILQDSWAGCYRGGWGSLLTQESFQHPAKMARGLAERIYQHVLEEQWVKPGDRVIDCFGGIAGTAFHAMVNGLHWQGVELEHRFVRLGDRRDCSGFTEDEWKRFYHRPQKLEVCQDCREVMNVGKPEVSHTLFGTVSTRHIPTREFHHVPGNIEVWEQKGFPGTARLLRGDSRKLIEVLAAAVA